MHPADAMQNTRPPGQNAARSISASSYIRPNRMRFGPAFASKRPASQAVAAVTTHPRSWPPPPRRAARTRRSSRPCPSTRADFHDAVLGSNGLAQPPGRSMSRSASTGPQVPGWYSCGGVVLVKIASTMRHSASMASSRANRVGRPASRRRGGARTRPSRPQYLAWQEARPPGRPWPHRAPSSGHRGRWRRRALVENARSSGAPSFRRTPRMVVPLARRAPRCS